MCILISDDEFKKAFIDRTKRAGLQDEQIETMASILWELMGTNTVGDQKSVLVSHSLIQCDLIVYLSLNE